MDREEKLLPVVSSLVVQVRPECRESVESLVESRANAEVYGTDNHTKIVVVAEMSSDGALADFMQELGAQPGVITVNMVFHHTDSDLAPPVASIEEVQNVR